jgi:glucosamine--fructose-6-phosphate aminotransferase (isomerizing)
MHFALDEQIASQPQALRAILERSQEWRDKPLLDAQKPIYLSGIGTSLHACRVAAHWIVTLTRGKIRPIVMSAHELVYVDLLQTGDQLVLVSHRGTKRFSRNVSAVARARGVNVVAVVGEDAPAQDADTVLTTCPGERSGTHTVSYTSALMVLGLLVTQLLGDQGEELAHALSVVPQALDTLLQRPAPLSQAEQLFNREPVLVTGTGLDAITASELALKIKEGTYQWAEGIETENALHGPPAAFRSSMSAITITPASDDGGRTASLHQLLQDLGVVEVCCGTDTEDVWFPGTHPLVRPLVSIVALQRVVAELARLRKSNPDDIHRDVEPWASAMGRYNL